MTSLNNSARIFHENNYLINYKIHPIIKLFIDKQFNLIKEIDGQEIYLDKLTEFTTGDSINSTTKLNYLNNEGKFPYIATKDIYYGLDEFDYQNGVTIPENTQYHVAKINSVLICVEGGNALIKMGITSRDICHGNKLMAFEPNDNYLPKYLLYFFMSANFKDQTELSGLIGGFSKTKFKKIKIFIPDNLNEQIKVVETIDNFLIKQNLLEKQYQASKLKIDKLKKAYVKDFNKVRQEDPNLSNSIFQNIYSINNISIDDIYELKKLVIMNEISKLKSFKIFNVKDLFKIEYGHKLPKDSRSNSGEYNVYGSNGIVGTHKIFSVDSPCVIIGRKGSVGKVHISTEPGCCVTDVAFYIKSESHFDLKYIFYLFQIMNFESKGIKPGINRETIYSKKTMFHEEIDEQKAIVKNIEATHKLIDLISKRVEAKQNVLDLLVSNLT